MKTLSRIFTAMAAIAAFAACQKEAPVFQPEPAATIEMTLIVSNPQTKVVMENASGNMIWGENESIAVFFGNSDAYKFDQITSGGTSSATFRGTVDESYSESNITEVYYPYVEEYSLNDYKTHGVSTTQNNLVLNEGQYELGRIPLHWSRATMGDDVILQSDRSAIVKLAKADVTHSNGEVYVAMYNNGTKVQDYTVRVAVENGNLKDDLVFIVDVPEYDGVRQVKAPKFVLNEDEANERAAIHTGWDNTIKAPKTIVPSKRYNIKPYVYFHNLHAPEEVAYIVLDNARLSQGQSSRNIYNSTWGNINDVLEEPEKDKSYTWGDYDEQTGYAITYNSDNLAFSSHQNSRKLTTRTKLVECDESDLFAYENRFENLTWDSPVGMRGFLDGKECVIVNVYNNNKVINKVAIATKDIGSTDGMAYGTLMTWKDAIRYYNNVNGWRLPTNDEINALSSASGISQGTYLQVNYSDLSQICFPFSGYSENNSKKEEGSYGYYWGSEFSAGPNNNSIQAECLASSGSSSQLYSYSCNLVEDGQIVDSYKCAVRQFHYLPITANTPVGAIGIIDGKEGMVVNLNIDGHVRRAVMATRNEGANSYNVRYSGDNNAYVWDKPFILDCFGSYLHYLQAQATCTGGWRIPSEQEWNGFFNAYPINTCMVAHAYYFCRDNDIYTKDHKFCSTVKITENSYLRFPDAGCKEIIHDQGTYGYYWSSTPDVDNKYRCKRFFGASVNDYVYEASSGFSVRLIHNMPQ